MSNHALMTAALVNGACACVCALILALVTVDAIRKIRRLRGERDAALDLYHGQLARSSDALERVVAALHIYGSSAGRPDKHHVYACREVVELLRPNVDVDNNRAIADLYRKLSPDGDS